MTSEHAHCSPSREDAPILTLRTLAWAEAFVLIPLHVFWMLYRSTPFVAENNASALVAAVPLGVMVCVGVAAQFRGVRAAIARIEWLLHLTAAACLAALLCYVTLRNPFSPGIPITWPLCFWSVCIAFMLLANLALHERTRNRSVGVAPRYPWLRGFVTALVVWGIIVWLAAGLTWPAYYWTASLVFHAAAAPLSRWAAGRTAMTSTARGGRFTSATAFVETSFMGTLLVASLLRFALDCTMTGSAESKYFVFVNACATPWFLAGVLLVLVASRLRITFVAHAVALAVLLSTGRATGWPISFVMGYALTAVFIATTRQDALAYALSALAATGIWLFGLMAYTLSGLIVEYKMGLTFAEGLVADLRVVVVASYGLWLLLAALNVWRSKTRHAPEAASVPPSTSSPHGWAYAAVWGAILLPIGILAATAMGHLIGFERAPRIEVGEPAGICHAGYSRSDEDYALLNELGAKYTRIPFYWGQIQPDPDTWKFEELDTFLDAAEKHNIRVVGVLGFDNDRVELAPEEVKRLCSVAPEDMPLFLEFVRRTVSHYKDRVYAWEIWNEPDLHLFWTGTMDEFYPLARSAAATIREVHPEARILGTAMTSLLGARSAAGIEGLHASGALAQVDHPSMHTYVSDPRAYYNEFLRVKNAAAKYGHPGPIWITEVGDPDGGVYPWRASSGLLAEHAMKAHVVATSLGIETVLWHVFKDGSLENLCKEPWNSEGFFGLVKEDDQWKPVAHAYALFSQHCSNSVIRSDLVGVTGGIAARQIRTALYRRDDGESALVLWFEPGLRQGAHARVTFDLGALEEPALMHDITSSYSKYLVDGLADVTEQPLFITFRAPDPDTSVHLAVESSPADGAWLLLAVGLVVWAAWASMRQRPAA